MSATAQTLLSTAAFSAVVAQNPCSDVGGLIPGIFPTLGHNCDAFVSHFAPNARYFHQHDGFKTYPELYDNCQAYAKFCPGSDCKFLMNGDPLVVEQQGRCHVLVPYLWSEVPANSKAKGNLEPHNGWEYIVAVPNMSSPYKSSIELFAEIETSYSVAFNWAKPADTPAVVQESTLYLLGLSNSASKGECDSPIAPVLTKYFNDKSVNDDVWRQQGDAVVLAAGGVCHVAVPYASEAGGKLESGNFVFTLQPENNHTYTIVNAVGFPLSAAKRVQNQFVQV